MKAPHFTTWAIAATMAGTASAAEPQAVTDLKTQYQASVAKSVQDLTEIYKHKLLEMRQKYSAAGDNASIAAITAELTRIGAPNPLLTQAPVAKSSTPTAAPPIVGDERYFTGKSWFTPVNSEYRFNRDNTGQRTDSNKVKTPFTWRKLDDGIVEVLGSITPGAPPTKWYFKFDNRKSALMGEKADTLPWPCRPER